MGPGGTPYATASDLAGYLPASTLALASGANQDLACLNATETADSDLRGRYSLPLLAWGNDLRMHTAWVACYLLMQQIGFAPQAGADRLIVDRYYMAVGWPDKAGTGWFPGIQRQAIHPDVTPTLATLHDPTHDLPQVQTSPQRGWQQSRNGRPVI